MFTTLSGFSKNTLVYETSQSFEIRVSDKDNQIEDITFDIFLDQTITGNFVLDESTAVEGDGQLTFDLSNLENGGFIMLI